jgi:hypothetical protein
MKKKKKIGVKEKFENQATILNIKQKFKIKGKI